MLNWLIDGFEYLVDGFNVCDGHWLLLAVDSSMNEDTCSVLLDNGDFRKKKR